jgi:hypothetical protein
MGWQARFLEPKATGAQPLLVPHANVLQRIAFGIADRRVREALDIETLFRRALLLVATRLYAPSRAGRGRG